MMGKADEVRDSSWKMKYIECELSPSPNVHCCKGTG